MKRAVVTSPILTSVVAIALLTTGCGAIRSHRQLEQPVGVHLTSGIGGTLFRLNKTGDLPNAFGGRDIWGGKIDKGFAEMKLVGIEDQTVVLDILDINRQSSETTMDRYKPFQQSAVVGVDVRQSVNLRSGETSKPYRIRLNTRQQQDIVISGIRVKFIEVQPYSVRYTIEDLQPQ
ncbi:MAG: hypothetical protein O7E52_12605 [Candidatus Poribacteria bacterium]|nr:hypothetical protein [Candidatus Poribacteria bacterium]